MIYDDFIYVNINNINLTVFKDFIKITAVYNSTIFIVHTSFRASLLIIIIL